MGKSGEEEQGRSLDREEEKVSDSSTQPIMT